MKSKGRHKGSVNTVIHYYSPDEKKYLDTIIPGHTYREIIQLFKNKYKVELTMNQIKGVVGRSKVNTGLTGYFNKGNKPFNKGLKQTEYMSKESIQRTKNTRFKKGQVSINRRPVGPERVDGKDGYLLVKVSEPRTWRHKHRVLWEKYNNKKIPKGYTVIFADRNKRNFDKNNLILVSRSQLIKLNKKGLIKKDADLTKTGINVVKLMEKISEVEHDKK